MKALGLNNSNKAILIAFTLSLLYWIYLFFTSTFSVVFDAVGYETLGRLIYQEGWIKYFETGPNREPLYPFLVSVAMRVADVLSISYFYTQKFIQILILFVTQVLTLKILKKCGTDSRIIALSIFYIGFSPAIVNSAFSLFSEIATYPLILGIAYTAIEAWRAILKKDPSMKIILLGVLTGILFILITSVKAIFEYIFPLLIASYFIFIPYAFRKKEKKFALNSVIYILSAALVLFSFLHFYKSMNEKYNGKYAFTNRGAWMLYGTVDRRMVKMNPKMVLEAISIVPGDGVCEAIFSKEECRHWTYFVTEELGRKKEQALSESGVPVGELDSQLIKQSAERILENPLKYTFFHLLESGRMLFWESTQICFTIYPKWLTKLFAFTPFKNGIRLIVGGLTIVSFFYLFIFIVQNRALLLNTNDKDSEKLQLCFLMFIIMFAFIQIYAFFCVLTRYSFPIVPLYILSIAFLIQEILNHCRGIKKS
jgi:hypothetical protein